MKKAFTIIEMLVVIAIVLILSAAAIGGTSGLIKNLRFNNAFNKTILLVQQARNLAITGKDNLIKSYILEFDLAAGKATLKSKKESGAPSELDKLVLDSASGMTFTASGAAYCTTTASITFANTTAETALSCVGAGASTYLQVLKIEIRMDAKTKSFSINKASGVPQM